MFGSGDREKVGVKVGSRGLIKIRDRGRVSGRGRDEVCNEAFMGGRMKEKH